MGTKVWPIALLVLLLLAFIGYWFSLTARMAKAVVDQRARIVFEMRIPPTAKENPDARKELQQKTVAVAKQRFRLMFDKVSIAVKRLGDASVDIRLPKTVNIRDVRDLLAAEGRVQLFWTKNIVTANNKRRRYDISNTDSNDKEITFVDCFELDNKPFGVGSPQYKKMFEGWVLILDSDDVQSAEPIAYNGGIAPSMHFSSKGAAKLESWCRKYSREKENLAFAIDGKVISIAPLKEGTILTDSAFIDGKFKDKYVRRLCAQIGGGRLPVQLLERKP